MKKTIKVTSVLLIINVFAFAQTPCEQKFKNAKNSIVAIINSGGSSSKVNQTATDVMTNMALNCPEMVKEFNKFLEDVYKGKTEKGLDGNVQGNYQTNQERQKNMDEFNRSTERTFGGQGNNNSGGFRAVENNENLISPNDPRLKENRNLSGMGLSGAALINERELNEEKERAINQIQNGSGGFKPVKNEDDLIAPNLNLESEIKNFENKLALVPDDTKPDLLAQANYILKTETNKQEAARKLNNLMREMESNKGNILRNSSNNSNVNNLDETETQETQPQFQGGLQAFYAFLGENLIYPKEAQEKKIEGKVYLSFKIYTDGSVNDITILKRAGYGFDEEAVRLLRLSPKWIAGTSDGRNVITPMNIPISFKLEK